MKKVFFLLIFALLSLSWSSCSNEVDPDYLPSFDGINVDENTIFLTNLKDDKNHIVYAVDTSNDKIIYKYEFRNLIIYDMDYNYSFDANPYIVLLNGKAIKLNTKTGYCEEFKLDFTPEKITIVKNKLWITPLFAGFENSPKDYFVYNASINKVEYITLPEGVFNGRWTEINNNCYFVLFMDTTNSKIYNYSNNTIIGKNLFNTDYVLYRLNGNYLQATHSVSYLSDIYYINSFEPLDGKFLFNNRNLLNIDVFESGDYAYFLENNGPPELTITKRDKTEDYKQVKQINFNDSGNYFTYCKNGYIWRVSEDNDGTYKVNMDDLSYEIIN